MADARRKRAMDLRAAGLTFAEIAEQLGYTNSSAAAKAYHSALAAHQPAVDADTLRAEAQARLDAMRRALWPRVLRGDTAAIQQALRIEERSAKMWGIDAPTKVDVRPEVQEEIRTLVADLGLDGSYTVSDVA